MEELERRELEGRIMEVLQSQLPGLEAQFDTHPGFGKLHGALIWDGFQDQPQIDRQHRIWSILRPALTEKQRFATGLLLTVTSAENNAMQEAVA